MSGTFYTHAQMVDLLQGSDHRQLNFTFDSDLSTREKFVASCTDIVEKLDETKHPELDLKLRKFTGNATVECRTTERLLDFMTNDAFAASLSTYRYEIPRPDHTTQTNPAHSCFPRRFAVE